MTTLLEHLPDEILLIVCQYLPQSHTIHAFLDLNYRLNCTIAQFCTSLVLLNDAVTSDFSSVRLLHKIGPYLQSLTIKNISVPSTTISLASNIRELTLIHAPIDPLPPLANLTDLNIIDGPSFQSIDILFETTNHIHSVYIASTSPITLPVFPSSKFSTIKQLEITLQTVDDFVQLLLVCPHLTCLNLNLQNCTLPNNPQSNNQSAVVTTSSTLRAFSLRTNYEVNINFDHLNLILQYLSSELEQLAIEISTGHRPCVDGQVWETYLQERFPHLNRFEFFIFLRDDITGDSPVLRLPNVFKTFQSSYWSLITPQQITGYYDRPYSDRSISIHTVTIPTVRRRRYFLN